MRNKFATVDIAPLADFIDGGFESPAVDLGVWVRDPNTGEAIQPMLATNDDGIQRALAAAQRVHRAGNWAEIPADQRASLLDAMADWLEPRVEEIAVVESQNTGIVITLSKQVNQITHLAFRAAAALLRDGAGDRAVPGPLGDVEILRRPWGTAVCIVPWNAPAALAAHKVASALAAGCPAILKPSEWAPYSCQFIARAAEAVGLPPGALQVTNGGAAVGARLVGDSRARAVSFTGGLHGGRAVAAACAMDFKPLQLELGGNNALVVMADADLDAVAQGVVNGLTTLNGQWCRALGRLLVHESVADELLERSLARLAQVRLGHSLDEASQMGPLVHEGHRQAVQDAMARLKTLGGAIHQSTPLPDLLGCFFPPTLVTGVDPSETLEEVFGPLAAVHTFDSEQRALELANQTPFGLGGYVFSRDEAHALAIARRMETGGVKINGVSLLSLNPSAPRPAWGISGLGEEGTLETLEFFRGTRVVGVAGRG